MSKNKSELPEDQDIDYSGDIITLIDEEGVEHTFELVDTVELENGTYVALIALYQDPSDMLDDDGELIVMKVLEEDGEEILEVIDDDDEFDEVSGIFTERLSDLYEFDEDQDED